jgi:anti-anti-sigma regulatory factor
MGSAALNSHSASAHRSTRSTRSAGAQGARFAIPATGTSFHARDLRSQVRQALQDGGLDLVVDCEGWNQFDLGTLSSLIQCAAACREHGASFELANMSNEIRETVQDLQLAGRLGLAD